MPRLAKILKLFLAVAVSVTSLAATPYALDIHPSQGSAGCHGHGHPSPAPRSPNYACCLAGHSHALPQEFRFAAPLLPTSIHATAAQPHPSIQRRDVHLSSADSADPPGVLPLRI